MKYEEFYIFLCSQDPFPVSIFPAPWNATLKICILDLLILLHFYGFFACVYVYAEPMEARIGCRILQKWSYIWLGGTM